MANPGIPVNKTTVNLEDIIENNKKFRFNVMQYNNSLNKDNKFKLSDMNDTIIKLAVYILMLVTFVYLFAGDLGKLIIYAVICSLFDRYMLY